MVLATQAWLKWLQTRVEWQPPPPSKDDAMMKGFRKGWGDETGRKASCTYTYRESREVLRTWCNLHKTDEFCRRMMTMSRERERDPTGSLHYGRNKCALIVTTQCPTPCSGEAKLETPSRSSAQLSVLAISPVLKNLFLLSFAGPRIIRLSLPPPRRSATIPQAERDTGFAACVPSSSLVAA